MLLTHNHSTPGEAGFNNLKRLAYFAAVVEGGSFTAAAARLGITKAVVSQQVARLERDFRTTLLTRTTRKVAPTQAGQRFYERCAPILKDAGDAFDELADIADDPSGTLRVTAPLDYGISALVPVVTEFTRRYPRCKVDAIFSDHSLDLTTGQVELAIRVGWLTDLHLQARQIASFRQLLVAPPSMRAAMRRVKAPRDIGGLPFIAVSALRDPSHWTFSRGTLEHQSVTVHPVMSMNETLAVREAVRQGAGLSVLPDFAVADDLATGRLVQALPDWALPSGGIHAVFPSARFRPATVRAFVALLQEHTGSSARASRRPSPPRRT